MTNVSALPHLWQIILCSILLFNSVQSAFEYPGHGWASGQANIRVVGPPHPDLFRINPALLDSLSQSSIGLAHSKPFSGFDLSSSTIIGVGVVRHHPTVLTFESFGDEVYRETTLSVGAPWPITPGFSMGMTARYSQISFDRLIVHRGLAFSPGLNLQLSENLHIGSVLNNFVQAPQDSILPQKFALGISYDRGPINLSAAIEKEGRLVPELKLALLVKARKTLAFAIGFQELSQTLTLGWKINIKQLEIYYTWMGHPYLPPTHGLGIQLNHL